MARKLHGFCAVNNAGSRKEPSAGSTGQVQMADDFWEKNHGITPQPVSDLDVWRAAQQVINRYPEEPELAACQRADAAYELGDMFNFELWQRVAKAVRELVRTKPHDGKVVN